MRAALAASLLLIPGAFGQTPAFEVASVKVCPASSEGMHVPANSISWSPGGITMMNTSLKAAVQWAYHMQAIQVMGPGWITGNRYDIVAKSTGPATDDQLRQMLQTLLADRFKLASHRETKEMQAYVFTVAKGGHKLKPSEGEGPLEMKPTGKGLNILFTHVTLARLAEWSELPLDGLVVDQTGLKGAWDFTVDASPLMIQRPADATEAIGMLMQMLNDQLGIKVDQKKVPAEVIVVDRAEKVPVEN
jgi:uncharacterized protein (TIGR03435 family)